MYQFSEFTYTNSFGRNIVTSDFRNIKEIILSSYNKKDIEEIDQKYLKGLNFIYVNKMSDVISHSITNRKVLNPKNIN